MTGTSDWISVELGVGVLRVSCPANLIVIHIRQTQSVHSSNLLLWKSRIYFSAALVSVICFKVLISRNITYSCTFIISCILQRKLQISVN